MSSCKKDKTVGIYSLLKFYKVDNIAWSGQFRLANIVRETQIREDKFACDTGQSVRRNTKYFSADFGKDWYFQAWSV